MAEIIYKELSYTIPSTRSGQGSGRALPDVAEEHRAAGDGDAGDECGGGL